MSDKVGMVVLYQPTHKEFPTNNDQQAAIITRWNLDAEQADLFVFVTGQSYGVAQTGVVEGLEDGNFQQFGTQSATAKAKAEAKKAQEKTDTEAAKKAQEDAKRAVKEAPHAAAR